MVGGRAAEQMGWGGAEVCGLLDTGGHTAATLLPGTVFRAAAATPPSPWAPAGAVHAHREVLIFILEWPLEVNAADLS